MSRLIFPDDRLVYDPDTGRPVKAASVELYLDAAVTLPALDLLHLDGSPLTVPGQISTDAYGQIVLFQGPDGVDTLYAVVNGGPASALYARVDDRLDSLAGRVATLETEVGTGGASVVHTTGNETVNGVKTFGSLPVLPGNPSTGLQATPKQYVDTGDATNANAIAAETSARQAADALKADLVGGLVPTSQLPAIATFTTHSAASQAAMLALSAAAGDVTIRTDQANARYLLTALPAATLGNWLLLDTDPTAAVDSVNGQFGTVVLGKADVGLGSVDNTADMAKPVSAAQQTALNLKAPLASPALTGTPTAPTAAPATASTQVATTAYTDAAVATQHTVDNAAYVPVPPAGVMDGQIGKWSDDVRQFLPAVAGVDYVDPTDYLIDQADRSATDLAAAHNDAVAGDNAILGLIGGAVQWGPSAAYTVDTLIGYGGLDVWKALAAVPADYAPEGKGDGSIRDRELLLQQRVGFGAASIGGYLYDTITVNVNDDYTNADTPIVGTARWAVEVQARAAGGGWIIFDKTVFPRSAPAKLKLKDNLVVGITSNITIDGRGAGVIVTGGDGTYTAGGQPGLPSAVATPYSGTKTYSGSFAGSTLVTQVTSPSDTDVYCCVDVTPAVGDYPIGSPRWRKVAAAVTNGTVFYEQSAWAVSSDTNTYALVRPLGNDYFNDGVANGTTTFTSATANFVAGDVGKTITILGTASDGSPFTTTIAARVSATQVTLAAAPPTSKNPALFGVVRHTLNGTVKVSSVACTVDPSLDRHDLNPVTGHWEPIGKTGWSLTLGFMAYSPGGSIPAKHTFTDPAGSNGFPSRNIIVAYISKIDNWGGESNDTGSHRCFQATGWIKDWWVHHCYFTNPCMWNDGLADVNAPSTNGTFSYNHFKQGHKAILDYGVGIFSSPAVLLVTQVNPDLDAIYGPSGSSPDPAYVSGGYAMWSDAANVVLKTNKLDSKGHVIDWSTVTFPASGALEVGGSNPEHVLMLSVDHSNSGYDLITLQTRPVAKKHLASADASGVTFSTTHLNPVTGTDTSGKKTQLYRLAHFLPGLTDDFPKFTDEFGVDWVDVRLTYAFNRMEQFGDRGPHADQPNLIAHLLDNYEHDWGLYPDPLIDPTNTGLSYTFPCVPFGLTPTVPSATQTSFGARLQIDGTAYEHAVGAGANARKMISVASAGPGYLKTTDIGDLRGDSTRDADALGGDFSAVSYAYTVLPSSQVKTRLLATAGNIQMWAFDHEASIVQDATTSTKGVVQLAGDLAGTASAPTVPGKVGPADTVTLTNKRITKRVLSLSAGSATPAINTDSYDVVRITAQSAAITSFTTNLTGTPVSGDTLRISITDDGTARALTWGASFEASTIALPTTTVANARLDVGFFWNSVTSKWRCVATA